MAKAKPAAQKFRSFDGSDYLKNPAMMLDYLDVAAQDPNSDVFLMALVDVAKARGKGIKPHDGIWKHIDATWKGEERLAQT